MKQLFLVLCLCSLFYSANAQLNVEYNSNITYSQSLNDIWGYAANGREYALVGLQNGASVVDVTDPNNPVELGIAPGPSSTWRDMKTWGEFAFITNETSDGILVIDLSNLPSPITANDYYYLTPEVPNDGTITSCHNIFIDEFGFAYLSGCDVNSGGTVIFGLDGTPGQMAYVGKTPPIYAHDCYAVNNKLYTSDIYAGEFSIYDVTNKSSLQLLGTQATEGDFTHNVWMSDDGNIAFTTDEVAGAPVGAYDVTDPQNIIELDQFRPIETLGDGVIPHNVHVWNDWIITSYYTDGCIIIDGSVPDNLIEVGNFDTFIPASTGFSGAWGAYPFLPSGTILVSDIGNGLYVLSPNYVRACRLEGIVTDASTNATLSEVNVSIAQSQPNLSSTDFTGAYKTGIATSGTFDVTYSKVGYVTQTWPTIFENGVINTQNIQLQPLGAISGLVVETSSGDPVPNANVVVETSGDLVSVYTDATGAFSLPGLSEGTYQLYVGAWGYKTISEEVNLSQGISASFILEPGYQDDFAVDQGWLVTGNANTGSWELGEPIGTQFNGTVSNPEFDVADDLGDRCYVTGNGGGGAGNDDVDDGETRLTSQTMDLSEFDFPVIEVSYWWFNQGGNSAPNDELEIRLMNSTENVEVATITDLSQWLKLSINVAAYLTPDENVRIEFITGDQANSGHLVEAGIDAFRVVDASEAGIYPAFSADVVEGCAPLTVVFSDGSDSTSTYNWNFPGGTPSTSTEAAPTVVYETPGVYSATLQAVVESGNTYNVTRNSYVSVSSTPFASYSYIVNNETVLFSGNLSGADTFSWDFGDGNGSSEMNPSHAYENLGTYTVTLSATNACGTFNFESDVTISTTAVFDPISGGSISSFPNPFEESFVLDFDLGKEKSAELRIFNSQGQSMYNTRLNQRQGQLNLGQTLAPGVYFVGLNIGGRSIEHLKVIKL